MASSAQLPRAAAAALPFHGREGYVSEAATGYAGADKDLSVLSVLGTNRGG